MATGISGTSTGSTGLDVASLVTQLVAAERAPDDKRLTRADAKLTTQLTAVSQLKGGLSAFQGALASLKDVSSYIVRNVALSDTSSLSASASSAAAQGGYDVEVLQLAKAAQLGSAAFAGGSTSVVGTGTLLISMGSNGFTVNIDSSNNTLAGIRDAINAATTNTGVQATLLTGTAGSKLVLTGSQTGATNAITVSVNGGDGGLSQLSYSPSTPLTNGLSVIQAAQDASIKVSGFAVTSATNTVTNAIDGVTLNLLKATPGTTTNVSVSNDTGTVQSRINGFVSAFNTLEKQIASLRAYDPATQKAGPMLGDAMLNGIEAQLRRILSAPVAGANGSYTTLASLGITSGLDGTLSVDATKLQKALAAGTTMVSGVFGGPNGVATKLSEYLTAQLANTGQIAARNDSISRQQKSLQAQKDALNARMAVIQSRYQTQFSALDTMLQKMQSTSSYLAQQLSNLSSNNK